MTKVTIRNKPRGRIVRDGDPDLHAVRVYQSTPEDIALQIWAGKRYLLAALSPAEARAIGAELIACADALAATLQA
jgi:hypothetical protein